MKIVHGPFGQGGKCLKPGEKDGLAARIVNGTCSCNECGKHGQQGWPKKSNPIWIRHGQQRSVYHNPIYLVIGLPRS